MRSAGSFEATQKQVERKWIRELEKHDQSGYTIFVAFSLAFALAGEWQTALTISRAASSIAERLHKEHAELTIKGDEAAYLCAIFSRLCAKSLDDLDQCDSWLEQAERLQKTPPLRERLNRLPDPSQYRDPRFGAEQLAIRLCRRLFVEFSEAGNRDIGRQLLSLQSIEAECRKHSATFAAAEGEPNEHIRNYVREQLACNFLQLQILAKGKGEVSNLLPSDSINFTRILTDSIFEGDDISIPQTEEGFVGKSRLVYFVYLCATALFDPDSVGWDDPKKAELLFSQLEHNGRLLQLMPYDAKRVDFFLNVVQDSMHIFLPNRGHAGKGGGS